MTQQDTEAHQSAGSLWKKCNDSVITWNKLNNKYKNYCSLWCFEKWRCNNLSSWETVNFTSLYWAIKRIFEDVVLNFQKHSPILFPWSHILRLELNRMIWKMSVSSMSHEWHRHWNKVHWWICGSNLHSQKRRDDEEDELCLVQPDPLFITTVQYSPLKINPVKTNCMNTFFNFEKSSGTLNIQNATDASNGIAPGLRQHYNNLKI